MSYTAPLTTLGTCTPSFVNRYTSHTQYLNAYSCSQFVCTALHSALTLHAWLKAQECASFKKSRSISHDMTHGTRSTSYSLFSSVPGPIPPRRLITSTTPCADPRKPQEGGSYPELPRDTGYVPNRIVDNQIINEQENVTCTEDDQITEIEDHVKALSYNQSFLSSTQHSALRRSTRPQR